MTRCRRGARWRRLSAEPCFVHAWSSSSPLSIFVGSTAPPQGLLLTALQHPALSLPSQISRSSTTSRCHSSKSKYLTRLRALCSLSRPVQSQALTSSDWLEQLQRLKCPAPHFLSLVSDFLRRVERDLRGGENPFKETKKNDFLPPRRVFRVRAASSQSVSQIAVFHSPSRCQRNRYARNRQVCRYSAETRC